MLLVNGGMMSEPLSAEATVVFFGGSLGLSGDGSGALDPTRGVSAASAPGAFASCLLPPHPAVSTRRKEKPMADSVREPEDRIV